METQQRLRQRLDNLTDLESIVRTMKSLSAANIRQYELSITALSGYVQTIERGLSVALRDIGPLPAQHPFNHPPADSPLGAIVFGSDIGLCGRFNEEIVRFAQDQTHQRLNQTDELATQIPSSQTMRFASFGTHPAKILEHHFTSKSPSSPSTVDQEFSVPGTATQLTATVQSILMLIDRWHLEEGIETIYLYYNRRVGTRNYQPTQMQLLPVDLRHFTQTHQTQWPSRSIPTFTISREILLARLLRQYLFVSVFRACAESQASEHASRLSAMQSAQRNLDESIEEVTTAFRRARQNAITFELLDIITGFEATASQDPHSAQPNEVR